MQPHRGLDPSLEFSTLFFLTGSLRPSKIRRAFLPFLHTNDDFDGWDRFWDTSMNFKLRFHYFLHISGYFPTKILFSRVQSIITHNYPCSRTWDLRFCSHDYDPRIMFSGSRVWRDNTKTNTHLTRTMSRYGMVWYGMVALCLNIVSSM